MADYNKAANQALALIAKNGVSLPIYRRALEVSEETGTLTEGETTQGNITGIVLPRYKGFNFPQMDNAFREALISGKMRTILAAGKDASFEPAPLDIIDINGTKFEVVGCVPLAPDGVTSILYTIGVTRCGTFTPTEAP